jgi:nitroreductase
MDVFSALKGRRSVRDFEARPIPDDMIGRLAEALIAAPSAGNLQSRKFWFVSDAGVKRELAHAALGQSFVAKAPLVVVACTDARIGRRYGERGLNLYTIQDASISVMCMMLAACEMGLGTVWVGAFDEVATGRVLGLSAGHRPVAMVPVGFPARVPPPTPRVSTEEAIVCV